MMELDCFQNRLYTDRGSEIASTATTVVALGWTAWSIYVPTYLPT